METFSSSKSVMHLAGKLFFLLIFPLVSLQVVNLIRRYAVTHFLCFNLFVGKGEAQKLFKILLIQDIKDWEPC